MKKNITILEKYNSFIVILGLILLLLNSSAAVSQSLQKEKKPHIVFLISEDPNNYEAHKTIPRFAEFLQHGYNYNVSVLLGSGNHNSFKFPNLEVISEADLVVIFFRRIALETKQLSLIKEYLKEGKPLIGIRTANHAFSVRSGEIPDGYQQWWEFVPEILGAENRGYGPTKLGTDVSIIPEAKDHPILEGVEPKEWHSTGNVYYVAPLVDRDAKVLLTGTVENKTEPIAWTRTADNSPVFYTSLGHPDDFEMPQFRRLLVNAIQWALNNNKSQNSKAYD